MPFENKTKSLSSSLLPPRDARGPHPPAHRTGTRRAHGALCVALWVAQALAQRQRSQCHPMHPTGRTRASLLSSATQLRLAARVAQAGGPPQERASRPVHASAYGCHCSWWAKRGRCGARWQLAVAHQELCAPRRLPKARLTQTTMPPSAAAVVSLLRASNGTYYMQRVVASVTAKGRRPRKER